MPGVVKWLKWALQILPLALDASKWAIKIIREWRTVKKPPEETTNSNMDKQVSPDETSDHPP